MRTWGGRIVVAALLALSVGGALALNLATRETIAPTVGPSGTLTPSVPTVTPFSPQVVASPLATGESTVMARPQTARASPGIVYSVRLVSPCVVLLDFDGRFWAAPAGLTVYDPIQPATVRILAAERVLLHTAAGQWVKLRAIPGPVTFPPCP